MNILTRFGFFTQNENKTLTIKNLSQFITHDIMQTPDMAGSGPDPCNCKREDVCVNIALKHDPIIKAGFDFRPK